MASTSYSASADGEHNIEAVDALTLVSRRPQKRSATRDNGPTKLRRPLPRTMLQAFDPSSFRVPIYNKEWKMAKNAMMFLADGSLVGCSNLETHFVEVHWPTPIPGRARFVQLPTELRFMIWTLALPRPRILSLTIDEEPEDPNQKHCCMLWSRAYVEPILYVRRQCRLESDEDPYFHNLAHLCHESRLFFLQHYCTLKFRNTHVDQPWNKVRNSDLRPDDTGRTARIVPAKGYIDFKRDTLEISQYFVHALEERDGWVDLTQLEHLAFCLANKLPTRPRDERLNSSSWIWRFIRAELLALKTLTFFLGDVSSLVVKGYEATMNLVKVDDDMIDTISQLPRSYFLGEAPKPEGNMKTLFKAAKKITKETKADFEQRVLTDDCLKSVDLGVALISTKLRPIPTPEQVWLMPVEPKYYGVCFSAQRPGTVGSADKQYFHAFDFSSPCYPDGILVLHRAKAKV